MVVRSLLLILLALSLVTLTKQIFTGSLSDSYIYPLLICLVAVYYFSDQVHLKWGAFIAVVAMASGSIFLALFTGDLALACLSCALIPVLLRFIMTQVLIYIFIPLWLVVVVTIHSIGTTSDLSSQLFTHLIILSYSLLVSLFLSTLFNRVYCLVLEREDKENNELSRQFLDHSQLIQHFNWLRNKNLDGAVRVYGVYVKTILDQANRSSDTPLDIKESISGFNQLLREQIPMGASIGKLENGVYILMAERRFWDTFEQGLRQLRSDARDLSPVVVSTDAPNDADNLDTAFHNLDTVFTRAQKESTDFLRFTLKDRDHLQNQTDISAQEVAAALQNDDIQMFFQPKVDIKDNNRLVGAEALVRWDHPTRGLLSPKEFVGVIEQSPYKLNFIHTVLEQSAHFCETMKQSGLPISVSFNLNADDLQDLRVTSELSRVQDKYGFVFGELQIELSEQETDVSLENLKRSLSAVKELGYSIALDDFGTGMSSLAYFQNLPSDTIKLDRAFIRDIHINRSSRHLVSMVVSLSHAEGLKVVAEGVEIQQESDTLLQLGVDQVQGYLYGKPMPPKEFLQCYGLELLEESE